MYVLLDHPHNLFLKANVLDESLMKRTSFLLARSVIDFDLVRLYHPDKASDVPPDIAHARFQAITHAYDSLRGKVASGSTDDGSPSNPSVDLRYQTTAAWRAAHRRRQQELYSSGAVDDKWKDRIILFGVVSVGVWSWFRRNGSAMLSWLDIRADDCVRDCEHSDDEERGDG
jgi:hypothetical protein